MSLGSAGIFVEVSANVVEVVVFDEIGKRFDAIGKSLRYDLRRWPNVLSTLAFRNTPPGSSANPDEQAIFVQCLPDRLSQAGKYCSVGPRCAAGPAAASSIAGRLERPRNCSLLQILQFIIRYRHPRRTLFQELHIHETPS